MLYLNIKNYNMKQKSIGKSIYAQRLFNIHLFHIHISQFLHIHSPTEFPRIGRFSLLFWTLQKENVGILPVAHPTTRRPSHCPNRRDGQRRSPRMRYIIIPSVILSYIYQ